MPPPVPEMASGPGARPAPGAGPANGREAAGPGTTGLTQALPNAGLSSPITETVLPHRLTGTCDRDLDHVARQHAGGLHGGALGAGVGNGQTRTREHQTTGGCRDSGDLLHHGNSSSWDMCGPSRGPHTS